MLDVRSGSAVVLAAFGEFPDSDENREDAVAEALRALHVYAHVYCVDMESCERFARQAAHAEIVRAEP